jgi:hypothetical protein
VNTRDRQCDKKNWQVGISRPAENIEDQSKTRQDLLWTNLTGNAAKRTGKLAIQDQQRTLRTNLKQARPIVNKPDQQCDKKNRQVGFSRPAEIIEDQSKTRQDLLWTNLTSNATKRTGKLAFQDQQRTLRTNLKPGKTYGEQTWQAMRRKEPASWLFKNSREHQRPI